MSDARPPTRLDHCVVHVPDWERCNAFYRDVIGAEIVPVAGGFAYRLPNGQLNLHGPGQIGTPRAAKPVEPGNSDLCFVWPGTVEEAREHLRAHGVELAGELEGAFARGRGRSVYFRDPDGSLLELVSYASGA